MTTTRRAHIRRFFLYAACDISVYTGVACLVYALRHPEKTDTQRLLEIKEALLWR